MDPFLFFILEIAIVVAFVYFYFWIRGLSRRIDRGNLNARLEELEQSVTDTTRWLETASDQIRRDIDRRMGQLKELIESAENTTDRSDSDMREVVIGPDRPTAATGAAMEQSALGGSIEDIAGEGAKDGPSAGNGLAIDDIVAAPVDESATVAGDIVGGQSESDDAPSAETSATGAASETRGSGIDTREVILELAGQGISIPEIAKRVNSSRSEVELVVALRKPL